MYSDLPPGCPKPPRVFATALQMILLVSLIVIGSLAFVALVLGIIYLAFNYANPGARIVTLDAERGFLVELTNKRDKTITLELLNITIRAGMTGVFGSTQMMNYVMGPKEKKLVIVPLSRALLGHEGESLYCSFAMNVQDGWKKLAISTMQTTRVTRNDAAYSAYFSAPPAYVAVPVMASAVVLSSDKETLDVSEKENIKTNN